MRSLPLVLSLWAVLSSGHALAGPRVGNGGGVWACQEPAGAYRWIQLVDLFEAEHEFRWKLAEAAGRSPWEILEERLAFVRARVPSLNGILSLSPEQLRNQIQFLPASTELTRINDDQVRVRPGPASCEGGTLFYGQLANYTFDGRLLVAGDLWNSAAFYDRDRAALLLHEIVYKALRDHYGEASSSRARQIVAVLFSRETPEVMGQRVAAVLAAPEPASSNNTDVVCFAHIESEADATIPGPTARLLPDGNGLLRGSIGTFSFTVKVSGIPVELAITDEASGIRTAAGPETIGAAFRENGRVGLSLELGTQQKIVSLECRGVISR